MPNKPDNSRLNIFGEHKTKEQIKVLSESDVYFTSVRPLYFAARIDVIAVS
jgi:hypothetical protein